VFKPLPLTQRWKRLRIVALYGCVKGGEVGASSRARGQDRWFIGYLALLLFSPLLLSPLLFSTLFLALCYLALCYLALCYLAFVTVLVPLLLSPLLSNPIVPCWLYILYYTVSAYCIGLASFRGPTSSDSHLLYVTRYPPSISFVFHLTTHSMPFALIQNLSYFSHFKNNSIKSVSSSWH
jgi:hypothetical protein